MYKAIVYVVDMVKKIYFRESIILYNSFACLVPHLAYKDLTAQSKVFKLRVYNISYFYYTDDII